MAERADPANEEEYMPDTRVLVCGTYPNQDSVEQAMTFLQNAGFLGANLSVLFPQKVGYGEQSEGGLERPTNRTAAGLDPDGILDMVARVLHKGKILLSVRCEGAEQALVARKIFERTDAESIVSSADTIPGKSMGREVKPNFLA